MSGTEFNSNDTPSPAAEFRPVAVIDIGASSIRMAVAEIGQDGSIRILEKLVQGVSLGKDTFTRGTIRKQTIEACVKVLRAYQAKLREYQITRPEQVRVVATSAVREAANRLLFLDRIFIATGLKVEPVNEAEIVRMTYLGIQPLLQREPRLADRTTVICEVGGGSTDVLILRRGDVLHSDIYRLGSLRLRETIEALGAAPANIRQLMESQIDRTVEQMKQATDGDQVELLALGGDIRFAASQLIAEQPPGAVLSLELSALRKFTDELLQQDVDSLIQRFHLSLPEAESVGPALLTYTRMAEAFGLERILITDFTLRDAVLREMSSRDIWTDEFVRQIIRSAMDCGRHYNIDKAHAQHVAGLAQSLFQELVDEHRLGQKFELILRLAAMLHETGLYVATRGYHKHSQYLISHSDVFGLSPRELQLVSLVARYHRRASPKPNHPGYSTLTRESRVAVRKLAAILRVADALDHSRSQRIKSFSCEVTDRHLLISVPAIEDVSLEQLELRQKGNLFEETYGVPVLLRRIT